MRRRTESSLQIKTFVNFVYSLLGCPSWPIWLVIDKCCRSLLYLNRLGILSLMLSSRRMLTLSPTQKAWLTGFIDGEGYIGILFQRKKQTSQQSASPLYHPYLIITNTNKNSIVYIQKILGDGKVYECKRKMGWSPYLQFKLTKIEVLDELLKEIYPFFVVKNKQAKLVIDFIEIRRGRKIVTGGGSRSQTSFSNEEENIYRKLLELNKRGKTNESTIV